MCERAASLYVVKAKISNLVDDRKGETDMKYTKRIIAFCVVMALVLGVVELPENTVYAAKNVAYITPAKLQMSLGKTVPITVYKAKKKIVFSIISGSNRISIKQTKKEKM